MVNEADMMLEYWKEHRAQARQCENQRATMSNLILVAATALLAFAAQKKFSYGSMALTIPLIVLGLFGMIACAKYRERFEYHLARAQSVMRGFVTEQNSAALGAVLDTHNRRFPKMRRVRLYALWMVLHGLIASAGLVLTVAAVSGGTG